MKSKRGFIPRIFKNHSLDTLSRNTFILISVNYIPNSSLDTVVNIYVYAQMFVKHFKNNYTQVSLLFVSALLIHSISKPRKENIIMTKYSLITYALFAFLVQTLPYVCSNFLETCFQMVLTYGLKTMSMLRWLRGAYLKCNLS